MKFYSTNNRNVSVDLRTAVLNSLPADKGLYMPESIPLLSPHFVDSIVNYDLKEIAFEIIVNYLKSDFSINDISEIINHSISFPAPVIVLDNFFSVLELWHGPSLAFKDFGARFMAATMSKLVENDSGKLTILVATSGDTGGAVAAGFYELENVEVVILYPKGKVSALQEKQLTTLGKNITALEVEGNFDDCQSLVKQAFLDIDINKSLNISSANSINIARLLPQTFYYFEAFRQIKLYNNETVPTRKDPGLVFAVPSGNFGNLTAGLLAQRMGLPVSSFIATTNINDVVPHYLSTQEFTPRHSVPTISNAMDVGNPSNFVRMLELFDGNWSKISGAIRGYSFNDSQTKKGIRQIHSDYGYIMDPHGAVAFLGAQKDFTQYPDNQYIILETAHPSKFLPIMNEVIGNIEIHPVLKAIENNEKVSIPMTTSFNHFKDWLLK